MKRIVGILVVVLYEHDSDSPRRSIVELRCVIVFPDRRDYVADSLADLRSVWYRIGSCNKTLLDIDHEDCLALEDVVRI